MRGYIAVFFFRITDFFGGSIIEEFRETPKHRLVIPSRIPEHTMSCFDGARPVIEVDDELVWLIW